MTDPTPTDRRSLKERLRANALDECDEAVEYIDDMHVVLLSLREENHKMREALAWYRGNVFWSKSPCETGKAARKALIEDDGKMADQILGPKSEIDWAKYPLEVMARGHVLNDEEVRLMCVEISTQRDRIASLEAQLAEKDPQGVFQALDDYAKENASLKRQLAEAQAMVAAACEDVLAKAALELPNDPFRQARIKSIEPPDDARAALDRTRKEARREVWEVIEEIAQLGARGWNVSSDEIRALTYQPKGGSND